ncbi:MAG: hypothetical protein FJ030_16230 [Chloroflexi bacterium]|nr:hypothetical protein [Chloroflexota bacterium]
MTFTFRRFAFLFSFLAALAACALPPAGAPAATETAIAAQVMTQLAVQTPNSQTPDPNPTPPSDVVPEASPTPNVPPTSAPAATPLGITGRYLMSFHACDTAAAECGDPRNHSVYLAQSDDGAQWSLVPGWTPYTGSVPDVIRRGETLYIFTPGAVARYHLDTGVFEGPMLISISGADGFVDPSAIIDDEGRLVLFFLHGQKGSDPAHCQPQEATCEKRFGSATEMEGSDGASFAVDEGDRATVTLSTTGAIRTASDPDIFFDGAQYVLYISYGPSTSVWAATELRGTYARMSTPANGLLSNGTGGIASGYFDPDTGQYWTYSHAPRPNEATAIRRAAHAGFSRQLGIQDWSVALSGASLGLTDTTNIESAGFAVNQP